MRSRIYIIAIFLLGAFFGNSQKWTIELEKHIDKSVSEIGVEMEKYFEGIGRTKANKYHKFLRWYDYASNHQNEEGYQFNHSIKNRSLLKTMNAQIKKYATSPDTDSRYYHGGWSSINPNNFSVGGGDLTPTTGRINCVAKPSPTSAIIYAGTATGGVWKSYNNGASWIPLWDGMIQTGVSSIVIDYNNPNHILALSGDGDAKFLYTTGVYHSYDAGDTWTLAIKLDETQLGRGTKLLQSKTDQYEFFICMRDYPGKKMIRYNISTLAITKEVSPESVFDIEYQTNDNNILWVSGTAGLFKKEGNNPWAEVNHANLPTSSFTRAAVAMAPSNENVLYYAVAKKTSIEAETFYGLYKSPNKGLTWDIMYDTTKTDIMTYQCGYDFTLDVDPDDENKVYIGTGFFYKLTFGGPEVVVETLTENIHQDIHNSFHIGNNHYVCTDGGISVKSPGSSTYNGLNNGLICTQFYDLDVYGSTIIGGTQDTGTKKWDIGDLVGYRPVGLDGFDCMIDPTNPDIIYTSTQSKKQRSTDGMITYSDIFSATYQAPMAFAVDNPNKVIIHALDKLNVSYDNGATFPTAINAFETKGVVSMSQCASNPNVLYLVKPDSLARTENFNSSASSVSFITSKISGGNVKGVLVHPDSCNVVFHVKSGYLNEQIFKSIDGGVEFEPYSQGVSEIPVFCIYYDHVNENGYYIGTELGVFYRNSTMDEWIPFSTYLPRVPVYDLKINNNYIYAATFGRGVWRSPRFKNCATDLNLVQENDPTAGTNSGQQIHKASNIIVSDRIIRGKSGTNVLYQAGNYIDLTDGFHAKNYNLFTAKAAGCIE
ncbi:MAG: hypothetical protein ACJA1A_001387 [Saprospiraceae bacterium]|jgi:hypothetical protein